MPYTQRKLNASRFDLSPEQVQDFVECWEAVCNNGLARSIREPILVQLLQDFSKDKVLDGIRGLIGRANYSPDTLLGLIDGSIPRERPKPAPIQFERPVRGSNAKQGEARSLRQIIDQMQPYRAADPKPVPRRFSTNQALAYMVEYNYAEQGAGLNDIFKQVALDQHGDPVYELKEEINAN